MNKYPKFIIQDDKLILGMVKFHRDLVTDVKKVKGGGWWRLNEENKTIILSDKSEDFGRASISDTQSCIKNKQIFTTEFNPEEYTFKYSLDY